MVKENSKLPPFDFDNIVDFTRNPFNYTVNSHSPSLNWMFANLGGIPLGYGVLLWGEAKSGKTLITNDIIAKVHEDYPEAYVIKFDTEMRAELQDNENLYNIDKSRYIVTQCNTPSQIFDKLVEQIPLHCQAGRDIKLIIIDSLNAMQGVREMNQKSVEDQFYGDMAMTIQRGLKALIPVIRKYHIALICTTHAKAQMDPQLAKWENSIKPGVSFAALHSLEYHVQISQNKKKDDKTFDEGAKDMMDKSLLKAHKIRAVMTASTCSPAGRTAEFTLDYKRGIVNVGEELATMCKNISGVVEMPNNRTYIFGDQKWSSFDAFANALETDLDLREKVVQAIKKTDQTIRL